VARPAAEADLDEDGLRALLAASRPGLATLPLTRVAEGWDNVTWRVGDRLAARLPRHTAADHCIGIEQQWLQQIADRLPGDLVPVAVLRGTPGAGFPFHWSVVPWVDGTTADAEPLGADGARDLARALRALHVPAPDDAPANPHRGIPLSGRASPLDGLAAHDEVDPDAARAIWAAAIAARPARTRTWIHGDLHVRNLIVRDGGLRAIIDWGDLCGGDPAVDLSVLWTGLDAPAAAAFLEDYGPLDDALRVRARGWALVQAALLLPGPGPDGPTFAAAARRTLGRLGALRA
jgi:aminoglycoside phosphotransferase (APT) family kinase protein